MESKVIYWDADQKPRALRGLVSIDGQFVVIERESGSTFCIPISRVAFIEEGTSP